MTSRNPYNQCTAKFTDGKELWQLVALCKETEMVESAAKRLGYTLRDKPADKQATWSCCWLRAWQTHKMCFLLTKKTDARVLMRMRALRLIARLHINQ